MSENTNKQCSFCKSNVNDYITHIRSHGVEKNSAFLLNFYTEGNTLLDIKDKVEKKSGKLRHFFRNMIKKEEIFRQMLRHYRRLRRKFGNGHKEVQNNESLKLEVSNISKGPKSCIFCKSKVKNLTRHFKIHGISKTSAYLLTYYEKGNTLLDLQNKISNRSMNHFNKIIDKKESFQQMILDYERLKSEYNDEDTIPKKIKETHSNERIESCMFCNAKVRKIYQHLKNHGVRNSSAFLLPSYEDGDTLHDIRNKLEKKVGRIKNYHKKLINKQCFQQMLRDYKRLCKEFKEKNDTSEKIEEPFVKENLKPCMFCKVTVVNISKHLKTHGVRDTSALLLPFYEDGDTLLDIQKKLEKKMGRSRIFHKIIDKECFKQMLLDHERLRNEFDEKNEKEYCNNHPEKWENHNLPVSTDSNNLQEIITNLKQTIDKLVTCINKSEKINGTNQLGNVFATQTDAQSIVKDIGSQTFQRELKHVETQIISKNIGTQTFQRDYKHTETQTITINAAVQTLQREQKDAETQSIVIEIGTQTNPVEQKHAETETGKEDDRFATYQNDANSKCSETDQRITLERENIAKEQRFIELEREILKMRLELTKIKGQDKEIEKKASPLLEEERSVIPGRCEKETVSMKSISTTNIIDMCTVQGEKNETPQKMMDRIAVDVPIRRGRSGGLSPSITPLDRSMRAPESTTVVVAKSRDSGRCLDTRKGKSESMLMPPSDNKISRICTEKNNCMSSVQPKVEQRSEDMVSILISDDCVTTNINNIKIEPNVNSCEKPPSKISLHNWVSMLEKVLFPTESDGNRLKSARDIKMLEKVIENLKMCLGYFLPPEWPVGKAMIYTLTPKDLADFPLDKFFDKYKQGLRKLFTNFQSETARCNEKLCNLRKNVLRVLKILNINGGVLSCTLDDEIDRILSEFLESRK